MSKKKKVYLCDNDFIRKFMHVITKFVFFTELFETKRNYAKEMGRKKEEKRIYISIRLIICDRSTTILGKMVNLWVFFFLIFYANKACFYINFDLLINPRSVTLI